jgi:hypothetical protein
VSAKDCRELHEDVIMRIVVRDRASDPRDPTGSVYISAASHE